MENKTEFGFVVKCTFTIYHLTVYCVYLGEVAHYVEAFGVVLRHYIEKERVRVIVQGFVIQETLCK